MVRRASEDDAEAIARLVNRAYEVEQFFVAGDRTSPEEVANLMLTGMFLVSASEEAASIEGSVYVEVHPEGGYFGMLAVDASERGRGIGRQLVDEAERAAAAVGAPVMEIHVVNLRTELFPYYRQLGYQETGRTEPYIHRAALRPCHLVVLQKPLAGVLS